VSTDLFVQSTVAEEGMSGCIKRRDGLGSDKVTVVTVVRDIRAITTVHPVGENLISKIVLLEQAMFLLIKDDKGWDVEGSLGVKLKPEQVRHLLL